MARWGASAQGLTLAAWAPPGAALWPHVSPEGQPRAPQVLPWELFIPPLSAQEEKEAPGTHLWLGILDLLDLLAAGSCRSGAGNPASWSC